MEPEIKATTDCFTLGSKSHYMCEDYSLAYHNPHTDINFAIICDGCSTGENTDVGARLIAHIAKKYLNKQLPFMSFPTIDETWKAILADVQKVLPILNLCDDNFRCLLSTAIILFKFKDYVYVYMYGDGSLVINYTDGTYVVHTINYPENAPDYIAYRLSHRIHNKYYALVGNNRMVVKSLFISDNWGNEVITEKPISYQEYYFQSHKISNITIFSDGIDSFRKIGEDYNGNIVADYIKELHNFKSYEGEFEIV